MKLHTYHFLLLGMLLISCKEKIPNKKTANTELIQTTENQMVKKVVTTVQKKTYRLRKYAHVKEFYKGISKKATQICLNNNIPPASLLAIAALESGWNRGYIGRITGNILSLGTRKGDTELPALRLPRLKKTNKVLFDSLVILTYKTSELKWENRPESLKKDYRPAPWAGTPYRLAYFKYHPSEKKLAHLANITDFVTVFIGRKSRIKVYRDARRKMDSLVAKNGKEILLKKEVAIDFVNSIGGKKNSYNFRKTWPKKVIYILNNAGLVNLTTRLHKGETFEAAW